MCAESAIPIPLYLMAKAPVPGQVKTRMAPEIGPRQSAKLARLMLAQTVANACRHWRGEVALCVWPRHAHPVFVQLAERYRLTITSQIDADLGSRMMAALKQGIARAGRAAVMGCDVPHCPGEILAGAYAMLARGENPVGPAEDGGFYLIGLSNLSRAENSLFNGICWDDPAPLQQVRENALSAGLHLSDLPPLRDIDRYADLQWLAGIDDAYKPFVQ